MNLDHYLWMGGYAAYVWPAYGITFFVFVINLMFVFKEKKQIKRLFKMRKEESI